MTKAGELSGATSREYCDTTAGEESNTGSVVRESKGTEYTTQRCLRCDQSMGLIYWVFWRLF